MHNDPAIEETIPFAGETKNCYIFEPEEGCEIVSKIYILKSVFGAKPKSVTITIYDEA